MTDSLFGLTAKYLFWEGPSPGSPTHTCFAPGELEVHIHWKFIFYFSLSIFATVTLH